MNENLQQALSDLITKGLKTAETAGEFIIAETPDVLNQLLLWYGIRSLITTCICLGVFLITLKIYSLINKERKEQKEAWFDPYKPWFIAWLIPLTGCVVLCLNLVNHSAWLQIWIAPKIWLIEYASKLIK